MAWPRSGTTQWVALQVEEKHTHPAENVLQYWPWLERSQRRLVLVHAIAPDARKRTGHRTDLTKWLGAMMERVLPGRFTYCRLDLGTVEEAAQLEATAVAIDGAPSPVEGASTGLGPVARPGLAACRCQPDAVAIPPGSRCALALYSISQRVYHRPA